MQRPFQIEVTVTQCAILMQLNEKDRISCKELTEKLGIDQAALRKALKTNFCKPGKTGIV